MTVKDMGSVKGIFESVGLYGRASGAKVNVGTSEFMILGKVKAEGIEKIKVCFECWGYI